VQRCRYSDNFVRHCSHGAKSPASEPREKATYTGRQDRLDGVAISKAAEYTLPDPAERSFKRVAIDIYFKSAPQVPGYTLQID
jgi:hypothetical protein